MSEVRLQEVLEHQSSRYFLYVDYLLGEGKSFGDTVIICSDGNIRAHSLILMENQVFNDSLSQVTKEGKIFKVPQFSKSVMRAILDYLYLKEAKYWANIEGGIQEAVNYFFGLPELKAEAEENVVVQDSENSFNLEEKPLVTEYFSTPGSSRSHKVEVTETEQIVSLQDSENSLNLEENPLVINIPIPNEVESTEYLTAPEESANTSQTVQVEVTIENNVKGKQDPIQTETELAMKKGLGTRTKRPRDIMISTDEDTPPSPDPFGVEEQQSSVLQEVPKNKRVRDVMISTDEDTPPSPDPFGVEEQQSSVLQEVPKNKRVRDVMISTDEDAPISPDLFDVEEQMRPSLLTFY